MGGRAGETPRNVRGYGEEERGNRPLVRNSSSLTSFLALQAAAVWKVTPNVRLYGGLLRVVGVSQNGEKEKAARKWTGFK